MNNKGFTLIEVICTLTIIALIAMIVAANSGSTLSLSNEEAYNLTKKNIISATNTYIIECQNDILDCNIDWNSNTNIIKAKDLIEAGYFKEITNPINNKDISNCLTIEVTKINNNYNYNINDSKCN